MWRVVQFARPCWRRVSVNIKSPKVTLALSISLAGSSLAFSPLSLSSLDIPKATVDTSAKTSTPPPTIITPVNVLPTDTNKKPDTDLGWQPTLSDVMHVTKLLLVGGLVWGLSGALIGAGLFKALASVGFHITRWVSIPACIFSGVGLTVLGLHRGLGHSLIYFINKGLAGHALRKIVPKGATEYTVIHWDAAVSRVTYSFKMKAQKSGFFAGMILRSLARRLDSYLLLVKDEDKLQKRNHLSEDFINRKLRKVIKRQMKKPLYIIGAVYGSAITAVAYLVWRGN